MDDVPLSVQQQVDRICDAFEDALLAGENVCIEDFCGKLSGPVRWNLLESLVEIDLHYYWSKQHAHESIGQLSTATVPAYTQRFPELLEAGGRATLRSLIACEFQIRQELGDQPAIDQLLAWFPGDREQLRIKFHRILSDLNPLVIKLYESQELRFTVPLQRRLEIGRQRHHESPPPRLLTLPDRDRLLIAAAEVTTVGRHHADCEQIARDRVRVGNRSMKSHLSINSDHPLPPDGVWTGPPPFVLRLGAKLLRVEGAA